jgi:hypothetical protein
MPAPAPAPAPTLAADRIAPAAGASLRTVLFREAGTLLLLLCAVTVLYHHGLTMPVGDAWKQGDWLVNLGAGPIRRGLFGALLLRAGDLTGVSPLAILFALQAGLIVLLFGATALAFRRSPDPVTWSLLLVSAGFFALFWAGDPKGSMRKELIGMAAMSLLLLVRLYPRAGAALIAASGGLMVLGAAGHEINVLLAPVWAAMLLAAAADGGSARRPRVTLALVLVPVGAAMVYALAFPRLADHAPVCAALVARGIDASVCTGAIAWLEDDTAHAIARTMDEAFRRQDFPGFLRATGLAMLPVIALAALHDRRRWLALAFVATALPVLPLFPVAHDWGRWVDVHLVSFGFLLLALAQSGRIRLRRPAPLWLVAAALATHLAGTPSHMIGASPSGGFGMIGSVLTRPVR